MKNIKLIIASMLLSSVVYAQQSVTVSWKGELNCQEITIDSVLVTNLTKRWTTTVFYPEQSIILHTSMGIDEPKDFAKTQIQVKPNPFSQTAEVDFYVGKEGMVSLTLYDIFGRTVASLSQQMDCGQQQVVVNMGNSGYYFLSVETPSDKKVAKLLSMYDGNGDAGITSLSPLTPFNSPSGGKSSPPSEGVGEASQKSDSDLLFDLGDSLQFMAYATDSNGNVHEYLPQSYRILEDKYLFFSNDSSIIAFITDDSSGRLKELWRMDKLGNNVQKITDKTVRCGKPLRSHSGTQLIFYAETIENFLNPPYAMYIVNTDGTGLTFIDSFRVNGKTLYISDWSPDNTQLTGVQVDYNSHPWEYNLVLYNIASKTQTILQAQGIEIMQAKFSPDGNQIFYIASGEDTSTVIYIDYYPVYKIDVNGSNNQVFMRNVSSLPSWSPQGDKMAYVAPEEYPSPKMPQLFVANADGSNPQQLTYSGYIQNFQWTPDGEKIVYIVDYKVCIINADGSGQTQLTDADNNGYDIEITPDGEHILYTSPSGIVMMKLDGSERKILNEDGAFPVVCKWMNINK